MGKVHCESREEKCRGNQELQNNSTGSKRGSTELALKWNVKYWLWCDIPNSLNYSCNMHQRLQAVSTNDHLSGVHSTLKCKGHGSEASIYGPEGIVSSFPPTRQTLERWAGRLRLGLAVAGLALGVGVCVCVLMACLQMGLANALYLMKTRYQSEAKRTPFSTLNIYM